MQTKYTPKMSLKNKILTWGLVGLMSLVGGFNSGCMSDETWEQVKANQEYQQKVRDVETNQYTDEERMAAEKRADKQLEFMTGIYSGALQKAGGNIITNEYERNRQK